MYDLSKVKNMHTYPKYKRVQNRVLHEKQMTQGYTCIFISLDKDYINMKPNMHKDRQNKYKWENHQN